MTRDLHYSATERAWLWTSAGVGLTLLNGAFLYGLVVRPGSLWSAMTNPVSAAFIVESLGLTGVLAYLLGKWGVTRLRWGWFVFLSLIGGMAFALPVVLLWGGPVKARPTDTPPPAR